MNKRNIFYAACALWLGGGLSAMAETDYTAQMPNDWENTKANFQEGREFYQDSNFGTGKIVYQSFTAPESGIYEIKFYAVTSSTSGRGFDNLYGDNIAQAYATAGGNKTTLPMTVINQTGCTLVQDANIRTLSIEAAKGETIEYGLENIATGGNWYTIKALSAKMKTIAEIYQNQYDEAYAIWENSTEIVTGAKATFKVAVDAMLQAMNGTLAEAQAAAKELEAALATYENSSYPIKGKGVKYDFSSKMPMEINAWTCKQGNGPAPYQFTGTTETYGNTIAGEVMYQTLTGLTNGEYEIHFYAVANAANGGGTAGPGRAYVYANDQILDIDVISQNSCTPSDYERVFTVMVKDGTLKYGISNHDVAGNWNLCKNVALYMTGAPDAEQAVAPTAIEFAESAIALGAGNKTAELQPAFAPENASTELIWTSSDEQVAIVSQNGVVTALADGTAIITATSKWDAEVKATVEVSVDFPESVVPETTEIMAQDGFTKTIYTLGENLFQNGSFEYGNPVAGWKTVGYATDAVASNFTISEKGGLNDGAFITTNGGGVGSENTLRKAIAVEPGKTYYFAVYTSGKAPAANNFQYNALFKMTNATTEAGVLKQMEWPQGANNVASEWSLTEHIFTADEDHPFVGVRMGWNEGSSFDNFVLAEVTATEQVTITATEADLAAYQEALDNAKNAVQQDMNADVLEALTETLGQNDKDFTTASTKQEVTEAIGQLNNIAEQAQQAAKAYAEKVATVALLATEKTKALALGLNADDVNKYQDDYDTTEEARQALNDLKTDEYRYVTGNYGYAVDLGTWRASEGTGTRHDQHWSGEARPYLEQSYGNWDANAWSISYDQDVTLPAGEYIFKVAGRQANSDGVSMSLVVTKDDEVLGTVADFPRGDTGLGINTKGETDFSPEGTYAFDGKGRGFEWRYVKFTLSELATVNVAVSAQATESHMWVSFCDATVQTSNADLVEMMEKLIELGNAITEATNINETLNDDELAQTIADTQLTKNNLKSLDEVNAAISQLQQAVSQAQNRAELKAKVAELTQAVEQAKQAEYELPQTAQNIYQRDLDAIQEAINGTNPDLTNVLSDIAHEQATAQRVQDSYRQYLEYQQKTLQLKNSVEEQTDVLDNTDALQLLQATLDGQQQAMDNEDYLNLEEYNQQVFTDDFMATAASMLNDFVIQLTVKEGEKLDISNLLTNADVTPFWTGVWKVQPEGWYNEQQGGNFQVMANEEMAPGGEVFMEYWSETAATNGFVLAQKVVLPEGNYLITGRVGAQQYDSKGTGTNITFSADDIDGTEIPFGPLADAQIEFAQGGTSEVTIGLKAHEGNNARWMAINKVALYKTAQTEFIVSENINYNTAHQGAGDVTLKRTIVANTWNTLVLPFAVSNDELKEVFGADVQVAEYSETATENGQSLVKFTSMDEPALQPNVPVLLKTSTGGSEYAFKARTLIATKAPVVQGEFGYDFVGTYQASTTPQAGSYFFSQNKLYKSNGKQTVKGTRAYLKARDAATARIAAFTIDGAETTGIEGLVVEQGTTAAQQLYNLNGQQLENTRKGIYIQNGKKVVVK